MCESEGARPVDGSVIMRASTREDGACGVERGSRGEGRVGAFFRGKDVLITGASGFLGRVLIEKLLREAPGVGTLFLLLRPKRGQAPHERLQALTDVKLFERLRREQPHALRKLRAVEGDAALPALGLSAEDSALLRERVAVVFHGAASVRFDDPYSKAVLLNVRGTRDLCALATQMPRLEAFVHVSTAFSNSDRFDIDEKLYPPPGDWRTHIQLAETADPFTMDILTSKVLGGHANTYVYTKALAEHVINEYRNDLPVAIIRPSVVFPAEEEPFPGWVDNLNGPSSLVIGNIIGAVHVLAVDNTKFLDAIPVDYLIRGMLLEAVHRGSDSTRDLPVHNATAHEKNLFSVEYLTELDCTAILNRVPRIYKRYTVFVKSILLFRILFVLLELTVSLTLDCILWCLGKKVRLLKIHRRSLLGIIKTSPFTLNSFKFANKNFLALNDFLDPDEKKRYTLSTKDIIVEPFSISGHVVGQRTVFPQYTASILKQEVMWEIVHFAVVGLLLLLAWKLRLPTILASLSIRIARALLVI